MSGGTRFGMPIFSQMRPLPLSPPPRSPCPPPPWSPSPPPHHPLPTPLANCHPLPPSDLRSQKYASSRIRFKVSSLKNGQSRSSGKELSSISGELLSPQKDVCIVSLDPITYVSTSSMVICLFRLIWDNWNEYTISSAILLGQVSLLFESLSQNEPLWTMPLCKRLLFIDVSGHIAIPSSRCLTCIKPKFFCSQD